MKRILTALALVASVARPGLAEPKTPAPPDPARVVSAAREVIEAAQYATLVTVSEDGQPRARIVDAAEPDADLVVWIATNPSTRKVAQLRKNPRATLFYFDPGTQSQVALLGSAVLVTDAAEKERHWQQRWASYYADGARGSDLILIRFVPRSIEIASAPHDLMNDPRTWRPVVVDLP